MPILGTVSSGYVEPVYSLAVTANNTQNWTVPAGVSKIAVYMFGGGGGGGTLSDIFHRGCGGGAAGNGLAFADYTVTPGENFSLSVGAGGTSGASGGTSFFIKTANSLTLATASGGGYPNPSFNGGLLGGTMGSASSNVSGTIFDPGTSNGGNGGQTNGFAPNSGGNGNSGNSGGAGYTLTRNETGLGSVNAGGGGGGGGGGALARLATSFSGGSGGGGGATSGGNGGNGGNAAASGSLPANATVNGGNGGNSGSGVAAGGGGGGGGGYWFNNGANFEKTGAHGSGGPASGGQILIYTK